MTARRRHDGSRAPSPPVRRPRYPRGAPGRDTARAALRPHLRRRVRRRGGPAGALPRPGPDRFGGRCVRVCDLRSTSWAWINYYRVCRFASAYDDAGRLGDAPLANHNVVQEVGVIVLAPRPLRQRALARQSTHRRSARASTKAGDDPRLRGSARANGRAPSGRARRARRPGAQRPAAIDLHCRTISVAQAFWVC